MVHNGKYKERIFLFAKKKKKISLLKHWSPAAAAKLLQSCPTLCYPIDVSPPGSPIRGVLQARTLDWVAISFSSAWKWKVKVKSLSCVQLLATRWIGAYQAPPSMGFFQAKGYWVGCHCLLQLIPWAHLDTPLRIKWLAKEILMWLSCGFKGKSNNRSINSHSKHLLTLTMH